MDRFTGVAVILDTFRNQESGQNHKDVSVLVNDGTKKADDLQALLQGCDARIRYHEERADFSVSMSSRLLIAYKSGLLNIKIDPESKGEWEECVQIDTSELLPKNWLSRGFLGLSASTGALADNHDIFSLTAYSDAEEGQLESIEAPHPEVDLRHHIEHELLALSDSVDIALDKIKKQEEASEDRIENLEQLVGAKVDASMSQRITEIEQKIASQVSTPVFEKLLNAERAAEDRLGVLEEKIKKDMGRDLEERVADLERKFSQKIDKTVASTNKANAYQQKSINEKLDSYANDLDEKILVQLTESGAGSWKMPFVFLLLLMCGGAVGFYKWYREMKKSHLL